MAGHSDIEFSTSDGLKLRGWLFSAGEKRPCILMSNGFSGTKEAFLDDFARRFQAAGYTAVVYDNRNWGSSDGEPRNETDPIMQTRDYFAAYDYIVTLPDVDSERVVYWGTSMSGGNVICAAAIDRRIRAVISQTPFVSGEYVSMELGPVKGKFVLRDRSQLASGGASMMVPVVPDSIEEVEAGTSQAILKSADVFPFLAELDRRKVKWEKFATMQSVFYIQQHDPLTFIRRVSPTPLLMVLGERDMCIPTTTQLAMYQQAQEPKRLHILRNEGHFGVYYGPGFEENIKVQLEFLNSVL